MGLVLFLDESGDHSLQKIDPGYPMFVLCGIVMEDQYHDGAATDALNGFKDSLLGRHDIILHTVDFTRNQNGFEQMIDREFRARFFRQLQGLLRDMQFKIVACAIRKHEHLGKYGLNALDPYMLSLSIVIERFIFECGSPGGIVVAESRSETFDSALELAFLDLKVRGTSYVPGSKIRRRIHNFAIRGKNENIAGLQFADVVATPIGRHVLGKKTYPDDSEGGDFFSTVEGKFRRNWKGQYAGAGLVVLPK
ncbi:MAG: DUF3800 domain-containing protein [Terriglobia bacterium]